MYIVRNIETRFGESQLFVQKEYWVKSTCDRWFFVSKVVNLRVRILRLLCNKFYSGELYKMKLFSRFGFTEHMR